MKNKLRLLSITIFLLFACFISINNVNALNDTTNTYNIKTLNILDNQIQIVECGKLGSPGIPAGIPKFTRNLYSIIKVLVPVAVIVFGILDFVKAVMAQKEQDMKEYQNKFIRRVISGVAIFLVLAIVNFVFRQAKFDDSESLLGCLSCLSTTESACSTSNLNSDGTSYSSSCSTLGMSSCSKRSDCTWTGSQSGGTCKSKE